MKNTCNKHNISSKKHVAKVRMSAMTEVSNSQKLTSDNDDGILYKNLAMVYIDRQPLPIWRRIQKL